MNRLLLIAISACTMLRAQAPAPYSQLDPKPYDPKMDVNMEMFISDWRESPPRTEHGSLVIRDLFSKREGDPLHPARRGAVLAQFSEFAHASLYARASTTPSTLRKEQKVFYVYSGRGTATAGGKTGELHSGVAVFIPANLEFTLGNTGDEALNMYVIAEAVPADFKPRADMLVRDENLTPFDAARSHWVNINRRLFSQKDGFAVLSAMSTVNLEPMTMAQPHASRPLGTDVLWISVRGDIVTLLGKRLFRMPPGTAFKNPGDGKAVHANINVSAEPFQLLWIRAVNPPE